MAGGALRRGRRLAEESWRLPEA